MLVRVMKRMAMGEFISFFLLCFRVWEGLREGCKMDVRDGLREMER